MQLLSIAFTHKEASVRVREALARLEAGAVLGAMRARGCAQAVVVSTCNRFELYLWPAREPLSAAAALAALERLAGAPLSEGMALRTGQAAIEHLFSVAAGLDSLVVGETEILGQVKNGYEAALAAGMTGKRLNVLFQRALYVGKRVRRETSIASGQTSVASVAVQLAAAIFGDLSDRSVLVLGAGRMAEQACRHFVGRGIRELSIVNRTFERAEVLAERLRPARGVRVRPWTDIPEALRGADVALCSTGADRPVLSWELVRDAAAARLGRSLFLIDIAMPRDVEESVHGMAGVYLYRLEDLERIVAENLSSREGEIGKARAFVSGKAAQLRAWADSVDAGAELSLTHSGDVPCFSRESRAPRTSICCARVPARRPGRGWRPPS
ncbi:MAG: glutamyl-tRNA reductase [Elusimicrobia bacterium]|nr:glutamyl-tRNA reductase [Elusimicrobiota bacterium]